MYIHDMGHACTDLPDQLLNQLVSMQTPDVEEQLPREMTSDLSTLTSEDQERLQVVDDTIQQYVRNRLNDIVKIHVCKM